MPAFRKMGGAGVCVLLRREMSDIFPITEHPHKFDRVNKLTRNNRHRGEHRSSYAFRKKKLIQETVLNQSCQEHGVHLTHKVRLQIVTQITNLDHVLPLHFAFKLFV